MSLTLPDSSLRPAREAQKRVVERERQRMSRFSRRRRGSCHRSDLVSIVALVFIHRSKPILPPCPPATGAISPSLSIYCFCSSRAQQSDCDPSPPASKVENRFYHPESSNHKKQLLTCFLRASSWSMIPAEVVKIILPNERAGNKSAPQFSIASTVMLKRGEMTPHLFKRPLSWMTILPPRWSSTISNSPM